MCGYFQRIAWLFAILLFVFPCASSIAQDGWQDVPASKSLLDFEDATRVQLRQSDGKYATLEQSFWVLDGGASILFHVTWMNSTWVLTDQGPSLKEILDEAISGADTGELGEAFVNRVGTQGDAQWLRYRHQGKDCVMMRQFGWCDCDIRGGSAELRGNRVAIGFYCANTRLDDSQIRQLFERIDL